jgi:hypothetical protein
LPVSLASERGGRAFFIRRRQVMPERLANDSHENPNGIAIDPRGASCRCDEISEIRFAAIKPLCGGIRKEFLVFLLGVQIVSRRVSNRD